MVVTYGGLATCTVDHACGAVYLYLATTYNVGVEGLCATTVDTSRAIYGGIEVLYAKFLGIAILLQKNLGSLAGAHRVATRGAVADFV